jgi:hypothetical protein
MMMRRCLLAFMLTGATVLATAPLGSVAHAAGQAAMDDIAAQIRIQGFACDKPLRAVKDKRRSRPDHDVWVLKCSNATYRVSRAPDMVAQVQPLR